VAFASPLYIGAVCMNPNIWIHIKVWRKELHRRRRCLCAMVFVFITELLRFSAALLVFGTSLVAAGVFIGVLFIMRDVFETIGTPKEFFTKSRVKSMCRKVRNGISRFFRED
jgi:hypothetical protein